MKILSMPIPHDLPIPAVNYALTFRPYLRYIEEQIETSQSEVYRTFLTSVATLIKANPELLQPIKDLSILAKHHELIELVKLTHHSQVRSDSRLFSLGLPSGNPPQINYFGYTDEFFDFINEQGARLQRTTGESGEEFRRNIYGEILKNAYKLPGHYSLPEPMMQWFYEVNGVKHYYKVTRRTQFADVTIEGELPPLQQDWVDYASGVLASYKDIAVPMPFERFNLEGFFIFSIQPETKEISLKKLNKIVTQLHVNDSETAIEQLKEATLSLIGNDNIKLGFLAILKINGNFVYHDFHARNSIVFGKLRNHFTTEELSEIYNYMAEYSTNDTSILSSLNNDVLEMCTDNSVQHIRKVFENEGINALKFIPIWHNDVLLGIVELGSKNENEINIDVLRKLDAALPVFREFFLYKTNAFYDYMNSFIMQRYTSIQKSVAWKFNEEVWNAIKDINSPKDLVNTPPVRFENLYPFYGAVDFRNSTQKQMEAIRLDYEAQLQHLEALLIKDGLSDKDSQAKEFLEQVQYWQNQLTSDIDIQEETTLRQFLDTESSNLVNLLAEQNKISKSDARDYTWTVTSKYGKFHVFHNKYEESIQELNRVLKEELLEAESSLQESIPHYFEKFQTDGIEYSLYAGEGINPSQSFSTENIKEIIDWQIDVMLAMAVAANGYKRHLSVPLETTQLILVHENTVDISYRIDERHFDVEGSYSIRYQVLKKRIDKVRLLNSTERLTQPGTIAIVYANKNSLNPYLEKIIQLVSSEKIKPDIEYLDLEQLQGIGKLKALRVKINIENDRAFDDRYSKVLSLNE